VLSFGNICKTIAERGDFSTSSFLALYRVLVMETIGIDDIDVELKFSFIFAISFRTTFQKEKLTE